MRKPLLMKHITQEEWDAMPEETQRTLIRVRTPQDKHTEMAAGRIIQSARLRLGLSESHLRWYNRRRGGVAQW